MELGKKNLVLKKFLNGIGLDFACYRSQNLTQIILKSFLNQISFSSPY
jgi:hypothetical protein